jgi:small subunit ribosomal protein S20
VPHSRSAKKRVRQSETRRLGNRAAVGGLRTELKKFRTAVAAGDAEQAGEKMRFLARHLDKLVTRGIVHKNQAARRKSRLVRMVRALRTAKAP